MRKTQVTFLLWLALTSLAYAQSENPMARVLAGMRTHTLTGQVVITNEAGEQQPAPAGMDVGFQVKVFGRAKKGPLMFKTQEGGKVVFEGIRSNTDPAVQAQMTYEASLITKAFGFPVEIIPTDGPSALHVHQYRVI